MSSLWTSQKPLAQWFPTSCSFKATIDEKKFNKNAFLISMSWVQRSNRHNHCRFPLFTTPVKEEGFFKCNTWEVTTSRLQIAALASLCGNQDTGVKWIFGLIQQFICCQAAVLLVMLLDKITTVFLCPYNLLKSARNFSIE